MKKSLGKYSAGLVVLLVSLLVLVTPVRAAVVATDYYDVSGSTLKDVWNSIKENSPNPEGWVGYSEWELRGFPADDEPVVEVLENQSCPGGHYYTVSINRTITWSVSTNITLPRWTDGYNSTCDEVRAEWARFLTALTAHEQGHDQTSENALTNANPLTIITGVGSDCDQVTAVSNAQADFAAKYAAEGQRLVDAIGAAGTQYDADTNHGANQGAVLNYDVRCGGCFIATAAYGTAMAKEIQILREFRDEYLLTNPLGRAFVDFYYRMSPPIAEFVTEHPGLKPIVRAGLMPAVTMSTVVVNTTRAEKIAVLGLVVLVSVALAVWAVRRRGGGPEYS